MDTPVCQPTKHEWEPHPDIAGLARCVTCGALERTDQDAQPTDPHTSHGNGGTT